MDAGGLAVGRGEAAREVDPDGVAESDGVVLVMGLCWINENATSWLVLSLSRRGDAVESSDDERKGL